MEDEVIPEGEILKVMTVLDSLELTLLVIVDRGRVHVQNRLIFGLIYYDKNIKLALLLGLLDQWLDDL